MTCKNNNHELAALLLRSGLGLLFIIGGVSKLSLLLNSSTHDGMVANYMGTSGYINTLFQQYLFTGGMGELLTPSLFLTILSGFELVSGIALVSGFLVRPLALLYAFLLWTFVIALPVMTVPGVTVDVKTYTSPAIFVQIRDIALSGMMFVLFNLGAGKAALDNRFSSHVSEISWDNLGLLLRFSIGAMFIVAGFFGSFPSVPSFSTYQIILAAIGLCLIFGNVKVVKAAGFTTVLVMLWYMAHKLNMDKGFIENLNGFKREFAFVAAGGTLFMLGGGRLFTMNDLVKRARKYFSSQAVSGHQSLSLENSVPVNSNIND